MLPGRAIVLTGLGNAVTLVLGRVRSDRTGGNRSCQPERQQTGDSRLNNALLLHDFSSADGNERSAKTDHGWPISSPWSPGRRLPYTKADSGAADQNSAIASGSRAGAISRYTGTSLGEPSTEPRLSTGIKPMATKLDADSGSSATAASRALGCNIVTT